MSWRGVIEVLQTKPKLPHAIEYSVVCALGDIKGWSYAEQGTRLDPQTLCECPWLQLKTEARNYVCSFLIDVWLYWFSIWVSLVLLEVVFGE
jgi:hypothetical protein